MRIFLFVKLAVKLEECMGREIKLDNFAINEQLVPNVQKTAKLNIESSVLLSVLNLMN